MAILLEATQGEQPMKYQNLIYNTKFEGLMLMLQITGSHAPNKEDTLAIFLIYASFVLVSSPIGATVHGYFYGIGSSEKLDVSGSPINDASIDNKPLKMMKIDEKVV